MSKIMKMVVGSDLPLFLLTLLYLAPQSSAQSSNTTGVNETAYSTLPQNVTAAATGPAVFQCGVSPLPPQFNFTIYSNHGKHTISCPGGESTLPAEALTGSCKQREGEEIAEWSFSGTSFSDSNTLVECELPGHAAVWATLIVFKNTSPTGCVSGGFFGVLLVAVLAYILAYITIQRSTIMQECFFREPELDEDSLPY